MLVAENPNLVSKMVIGQSYENRSLNVLKVKLKKKKKQNWINLTNKDLYSKIRHPLFEYVTPTLQQQLITQLKPTIAK